MAKVRDRETEEFVAAMRSQFRSRVIEATGAQRAIQEAYALRDGTCEVWMGCLQGLGDVMHVRSEAGTFSYDADGVQVGGCGGILLHDAMYDLDKVLA